MFKVLKLTIVLAIASAAAMAQDTPPQTLITNVHVFDDKSNKRIGNANVLVEGNLIKTISTKPINADGATVIDGGGRTLMPGLIDAHVHLYRNVSVSLMFTAPKDDLYTLTIIEWLDEYTIPV